MNTSTKMNRLILNIIPLYIWIATVSGLICLRCDQTGDAPCTTLQQCQVFPGDRLSTEVCQNDYRIVNNVVTIRKKCKARKACADEEKLPDNNCDEHGGRNTVCRCCCETDKCNSLKKGCVYPSDCDKPRSPKNGFKRCPDPFKRNQKCTFHCNLGYELKGNKQTVCTRLDASGTLGLRPPKIPKCVRMIIRCLPPHTDPENGRVFCQNSEEYVDKIEFNYEGSRCRFECDENHALVGAERSACRFFKGRGKWTQPPPKCVRGQCPKLPADDNRVDTCTEGNLIGSNCKFECKEGYKLVGVDNNECRRDLSKKTAGRWSRPPPRCAKILCEPEQVDPSHGSVSCTDENFEGSVCTFTCDKGYDMDGTNRNLRRITCEDDDDGDAFGKWSGKPPTCTILKCLPPQISLSGGKVVCTNKNFLESVCTYTCDAGFDISGTSEDSTESVCEDDGDGDDAGKWSADPPTCVRIICKPPHTDPDNGKVVCSKENRIDSVCTFSCNKQYDLDGTDKETRTSKCVDDGDGDGVGNWNGPPGTCTLKTCEPELVAPENGLLSCTNGNTEGSVCRFTCSDGYDLDGTDKKLFRITCQDDNDGDALGKWSDKPPTCTSLKCLPPQTFLSGGEVECTSENFLNSVCTYTCDAGFDISGTSEDSTEAVCEDDGDGDDVGKWSADPPTCVRIICKPRQTDPDNGKVVCSKENHIDSVCTFSCSELYDLDGTDKETRTSKCVDDGDGDEVGRWDGPPGTCTLKTCEPEPAAPGNGSLSCTNGNIEGSRCAFVCNKGYALIGKYGSTCKGRKPRGVPEL